eukprot:1530500-Amphidinium_carterae.1
MQQLGSRPESLTVYKTSIAYVVVTLCVDIAYVCLWCATTSLPRKPCGAVLTGSTCKSVRTVETLLTDGLST